MKRFLRNQYCESRGVPSLRPILHSWIKIQLHYSTAVRGDCSWYYRERTCIGFLAAAVWQARGVAREEWQTEKGSKARRRQGRCDLWIFRPKRYEFHVEAKHMWLCATSSPNKQRQRIEDALHRATDDAQRLICSRKQRLSILFIAPYIPRHKLNKMAEHLLGCRKVVDSIPHDAIAWTFQDRSQLRLIRGEENVGIGLVLIARQAKG